MTEGPTDFGVWIENLRVQRKLKKKELAKKAGIDPSTYSREVGSGSMGWKPLLRLALAIEESPSEVLRRAGKHEEADLIERCYGPPPKTAAPFRDVLALLEQLPAWAPQVVRWLEGIRDVLRSQSGSGSALAGEKPAGKRRPATRAVRAKSAAESTATT